MTAATPFDSDPASELDGDACYRALQTHDARFDGRFFTAVTSTGIYCRPVCRVKLPRRENCRFFRHAAQAEAAGFRPCLRCRPELAPHATHWSTEDASRILARQAARLLDDPETWLQGVSGDAFGSASGSASDNAFGSASSGASHDVSIGVTKISATNCSDTMPRTPQWAARLGVSDRHLRRIFVRQFGVSPLQYLQTRRLLTARQLIADTRLPLTQVAFASGFASVRRFNAAFTAHYGLPPGALRRHAAGTTGTAPGMIEMRLGYRPPYDAAAMLDFLARRALPGVECVAPDAQGRPGYWRTLCIAQGTATHVGWLHARFDATRAHLLLHVSDTLAPVLPAVIHRVRALFDLDADPMAINATLHADFPQGDGVRVPGAVDGLELAVRAVLGQQVSVAAARTFAARLAARAGATVDTGVEGLTRLFPDAAALARLSGDALGEMGIVRQRQAALHALAYACDGGRLALHARADVPATLDALRALPGIGDWTAQYIAMRALRWPDAFPAGDLALQKALGVRTAREAGLAARRWQPWRSYAVVRAWQAAALPGAGTTVSAAAQSSVAP